MKRRNSHKEERWGSGTEGVGIPVCVNNIIAILCFSRDTATTAGGFYILRQIPMEHHAQSEADDDSEMEETEEEDEEST